MNILQTLRERFRAPLASLATDVEPLLAMIRPSQDAKFGDYQANFAMPLQKQLGKPAREIAAEVVSQIDLSDICEPLEIAGPGFINLKLRNDWLVAQLQAAIPDERLAIQPTTKPRKFVVDYSGPNVAKPMHVGHIRSTVIGDALDRVLRFLGHSVISDNHVGDWGTQFGMIIYGYKHFVDPEAFLATPVLELSRLYRLVSKLVTYRNSIAELPKAKKQIADREIALGVESAKPKSGDKKVDKEQAKVIERLQTQLKEEREELVKLQESIAAVGADPKLAPLAEAHPDIALAVLAETAKLHSGDEENLKLWHQFLPHCRDEISRVYRRLNVSFDHELGESFFHSQLAPTVAALEAKGLARESDGALCVFLEGHDAPMIVRKKDGAYLYATTDLATIRYRIKEWQAEAILYVVDHRQSDHFVKLFAVAKMLENDQVEMQHVQFGTIMGEDKRPYKTRSGDTVGLEGLLNESVSRAFAIVSENDDRKPNGPELSEETRQAVAETVGIGAIKYADLSQNRTTDYVFSYDKMLAMEGNTATYMQYSYARVRAIFRRNNVAIETLRSPHAKLTLEHPAERALALGVLQFHEAIEDVLYDYRPNILTGYLFGVAKAYSTFYDACPVLKAETPELKTSRLLLCDLTARTIKLGLQLLNIGVNEQM